MSWGIITIIVFGAILLFIFMGVPVAVALGLVGILSANLLLGGTAVAEYVPWRVCNSFVLTALPLFIFMGEVLLYGEISKRIYDGSVALVGNLPGGLLHGNIVSCAIFAAVSGSSVATAATMGTIAIPELEKRGYDSRIVLGSLAGGGTLGILIPPSMPLIIYAVLVEESVGRLFIAGVFPGVMLALLFMIYIAVRSKMQPKLAPPLERMGTLKLRILRALRMWPIFVIVVIIIGGIYLGVTTPTEAAALSASVALIFSLAYRKMTWSNFQKCLLSTVKTSVMVLFIVIGASIVAGTLGILRVPDSIATWVTSLELAPLLVLSFIFLMYIFLGCFFEGLSMMVLTMSVVHPIILSLGFDSIWFGIALVVLIEMAALTPPVGLNLYVIHGLRPDRPMTEVIIGSMPFFLLMIVALAIITAFPTIATWLPSTMMG